MVKLNSGGVCLSTSVPVHLVADLSGWFTEATDFVGTTPHRILDTRLTGDPLVPLILAATFWILGFGLFLIAYGPILLRPRADGKPG